VESNQSTILKLGTFLLSYAGCLLLSILFNFPSLLFLAGFPSVYASIVLGSAMASIAATFIWPVPKQDIELDIREKKLHIVWWIATFFLSTFLLYHLVIISGWLGSGNIGVMILAAVTTPVSRTLLHFATKNHTRYLPEILATGAGLSMIVLGPLSQSLYVIGFMCSYAAYLCSKHFLDNYLQAQRVENDTPGTPPRSIHVAEEDSPEWCVGPVSSSQNRFLPALDARLIWIQRLDAVGVVVTGIMMFLCGTITSWQPYVLWILPVTMVLSTLLMSGNYMLAHYGLRHMANDSYVKPINILLFNIGFVLACIALVIFALQYKLPTWYAIRAVTCIQWSQFIPQLAVFDLMVMCALYYMVEEYKVDKRTLCIIFCGIALGGTLLNIFCPSLLFLFTPELQMGCLLFMCASTLFLSCFCNAFTYDGLTTGQAAGTMDRASSPVKSEYLDELGYRDEEKAGPSYRFSADRTDCFRCF